MGEREGGGPKGARKGRRGGTDQHEHSGNEAFAFPSPNSQKKLQEGEDLTVPAATDLEIARIDR